MHTRGSRRRILLVAVALLAVAWWHLRSSSIDPQKSASIAFPVSNTIQVNHIPAGKTLILQDKDATPLASAETFGRSSIEFRTRWKAGMPYIVYLDGRCIAKAVAPDIRPTCRVRLHAPLGQTPHEVLLDSLSPKRQECIVPVTSAASLDLMLEVESLTDEMEFAVKIKGDSLWMRSSLSGAEGEGGAARLRFEWDKAIWTAQYAPTSLSENTPRRFNLQINGKTISFLMMEQSTEFLPDTVSLVRWTLPSDPNGQPMPDRPPDRIRLTHPIWARAAEWLGIRTRGRDQYIPFTWQTVWLRHDGKEPLTVLLRTQVLDAATGEPVVHFNMPPNEAHPARDTLVSFARLTPGRDSPCVLPLYLRDNTPPGTYLREVKVIPLGSDTPLLTVQAPLDVSGIRLFFVLWFGGVTLLVTGWLVWVIVSYKRILRTFGVRILVLLALLGSLQFALQFGGGWVASLFYSFLGPFNCLVGGLLTEVLTYLLVTSMLFLVPRVGAMTFAGLVTYFMGGILFGAFSIIDLFFIGSAIAFRELFLYGFGITHTHSAEVELPVFRMMLALALADAFSTLSALVLQGVFYRLFFAEWYIVLQVGVTGFLYTLLGVWLGVPLGRNLRKVHP